MNQKLNIKHKLFILLGIFAFTFLLYFNTLSHDYALDDMIVTTDNPLVKKGFEGIGEIVSHGYFYANTGRNDESYRPLSMVMIAIETQFFGLNPSVNHFFNVFFYAFSGIFLFLLLKQLFRKQTFIIPLFISLLFIAHPIHTEVVANVKSRDEIMQFFFIVLTLLFLIKYIHKKNCQTPLKVSDNLKLIASFIFYFLALMSKETAITFLVIIPLMLYFFTDIKLKNILLSTLPFFIIFGIYMLLRISILDTIAFDNEITVYQNSLMAANSFQEFIATNLFIHLKYLLLLVFPHPLSWDYSFNQIPIINLTNYKSIISIIVFLGLIIFAFISFKKKNPISFAIFFYLVTISIVSNFVVKIASTMGERFIFTSSLGFVISLVFVLTYLFKINKTDIFKNIPFIIVIAIIMLGYSYKTIERNKVWKNNFTIFESGIKTAPNSSRVHLTMADIYFKKVKKQQTQQLADIFLQKSISEYETAIIIYPNNPEAYYSYGYMLYSITQKDKALEQFYIGLQFDSLHVDMLNYVGIIFTEKGNLEEGEKYFSKILSIKPDYIHALNNIAYIYTQKNEIQKAINAYEKIIELGKADKETYLKLEKLKKMEFL